MTAKIETLKPRDPGPSIVLDRVVEQLRQSREITHNIRHGGKIRELPSTSAIREIMDSLVASLFPVHLGPVGLTADGVDIFVSSTLYTACALLNEQVYRGLQFDKTAGSPVELQFRAKDIVRAFAQKLPAIRGLLVEDFKAIFQNDPSAASIGEVLLYHRSSTGIIYYRIAHVLNELGARLVARIISDLAHTATGIDIHPGAKIGSRLLIERGTGVVIGETAIVGDNVHLHQGVTLGAGETPSRTGDKGDHNHPRHPIVEDNVVIHAGAVILGRITIGAGSVICGNVWLTRSVPRGSFVTQADTTRSEVQILD